MKYQNFRFIRIKVFENIAIAEEGYSDHLDSKKYKGRYYGEGDVQLMSAGSGVLHGEIFPLIHEDKDNPLRLFQIWLNLPSATKITEPHYKLLWHENIPIAKVGQDVKVKVIFMNTMA
jgi:redox-sensitive bicupin YhaK (pirin superfamily)